MLATLIGLLGDFDLAEEAAQEAFAVAAGWSWLPPRARGSSAIAKYSWEIAFCSSSENWSQPSPLA